MRQLKPRPRAVPFWEEPVNSSKALGTRLRHLWCPTNMYGIVMESVTSALRIGGVRWGPDNLTAIKIQSANRCHNPHCRRPYSSLLRAAYAFRVTCSERVFYYSL